jgi:3-hydroxypropanoate dehydrogenase
MSTAIAIEALRQLFYDARSFHKWTRRPIEAEVLEDLYRLTALGPTSGNSSPARFVFVRSEEGKTKLARCAMDFNKTNILSAPVTVIVASDTRFYDEMHKLLPARPEMAEMFRAAPPLAEVTAFRNSSLEAGYLILAARALGLDTGPMSGFDNAALDAAFFPDGRFKSNMICSVGYGDAEDQSPRLPRLPFEDAASFA